MDYYTYNLPCEAFTVTSSNGVPAHFYVHRDFGRLEVRIAHGYAGVFGLGERYDAVNYMGKTAVNAVEEKFCRQGDKTYCPMPFFWTDPGLGVYAETARVTALSSAPGQSRCTCRSAARCTSSPARRRRSSRRICALTGEPVLPPDWAFGPWISANHWDSREKLEHAVAEAEERGFPVSVAVVEAWSDEATFYIFRGAEYEPKAGGKGFDYAGFDFSRSPWPDPKGMIERLHEKGSASRALADTRLQAAGAARDAERSSSRSTGPTPRSAAGCA